MKRALVNRLIRLSISKRVRLAKEAKARYDLAVGATPAAPRPGEVADRHV